MKLHKWATYSVRVSSKRFLYAVRRNLILPRNFVIAENHRRFWRRHPSTGSGQENKQWFPKDDEIR